MVDLIKNLAVDERGATAIEYGLIVGFIALGLVTALPTIKENLASVFGTLNTQLSSAAGSGAN